MPYVKKEIHTESKEGEFLNSEWFIPLTIDEKKWKTVEHYVCYKIYESRNPNDYETLSKIKNSPTAFIARFYVKVTMKYGCNAKRAYYDTANGIKFSSEKMKRALLLTDPRIIIDDQNPRNAESLTLLRAKFKKEEREEKLGKKRIEVNDYRDVQLKISVINKFIEYVNIVKEVQRKRCLDIKTIEDAIWNLGDTPRRKNNFMQMTLTWLLKANPTIMAKKMILFERKREDIERGLSVENRSQEISELIASFARAYEVYMTPFERNLVMERMKEFVKSPSKIVIRPLV